MYKLKKHTEFRENLRPWAQKLPNWSLTVITIFMLPLYLIVPMFDRVTIGESLKEWWKQLHTLYVDRNDK